MPRLTPPPGDGAPAGVPGNGRHDQHRVRITSPFTSAAPARLRRSARQEIDESTGVGEVYIRSIIRAQLRAALAVLLTVCLTLGALPLAFLWSDDLSRVKVLGLPLAWVVLGGGVYVGIVVLGWVYVRHAERVEADFAELVESADADPDPDPDTDAGDGPA